MAATGLYEPRDGAPVVKPPFALVPDPPSVDGTAVDVVDVAAPVVAVCMRVLIVSSGNMAQCSVVPASAPLSMCP